MVPRPWNHYLWSLEWFRVSCWVGNWARYIPFTPRQFSISHILSSNKQATESLSLSHFLHITRGSSVFLVQFLCFSSVFHQTCLDWNWSIPISRKWNTKHISSWRSKIFACHQKEAKFWRRYWRNCSDQLEEREGEMEWVVVGLAKAHQPQLKLLVATVQMRPLSLDSWSSSQL